jgi:hypothetical protein
MKLRKEGEEKRGIKKLEKGKIEIKRVEEMCRENGKGKEEKEKKEKKVSF